MAQSTELKKIAEGREAEMFAWGDGKILRLMRGSDASGRARMETDMLVLKGARERGLRVPVVFEVVEVMSRPGLVMERIEGADLLTIVGRQPWRLLWVAGVTARAQAAMHQVQASAELPSIKERITRVAGNSPQVPERVGARALEALAGLPDGDRLCHGDFHPGNIIMSSEGPVIIDWSNVSRGDPLADVARTVLMLAIGEPPPGSSPIVTTFARFGGKIMLWSYLRAYRRASPLDMELVNRWKAVRIADRLAEGIPEERPALLRLASKAYGIAL